MNAEQMKMTVQVLGVYATIRLDRSDVAVLKVFF